METIKTVLVDDHDIVRNGIKSLLEREDNIKVIGEASNGEEAISVVDQLKPDMVIMDIKMPGMNGIEATKAIKTKGANPRIIILSMHDIEDYVLKAIDSGADGYLLKDTSRESLIKAINKVNNGEKYYSGDISQILVENLMNKSTSGAKEEKPNNSSDTASKFNITKREKEVLKMVVEGRTNKDIAETLEKSVRTVETHRFKIMKKLGVHNAIEMLKVVEEHKLLED